MEKQVSNRINADGTLPKRPLAPPCPPPYDPDDIERLSTDAYVDLCDSVASRTFHDVVARIMGHTYEPPWYSSIAEQEDFALLLRRWALTIDENIQDFLSQEDH